MTAEDLETIHIGASGAIFGIMGGLIACITTLDMNPYQFIKGAKEWFKPWDAQFGLIKALF